NYNTSLYADANESGGEEAVNRLSEQLASESYEGRNPEEMMIESEDARRLEHEIETSLSPFEKQVMELCLTGMGYIEIARILGRTEKATDNALQRIRTKLRKLPKNE
ncbi:MAG: LuxR C-terminal-related transcriptional regulator, partial [Lachnospiraceae bacterium]|nr:LuxR C-terminal-related transcriptional regulator [Lachnospiraceae bacterium]